MSNINLKKDPIIECNHHVLTAHEMRAMALRTAMFQIYNLCDSKHILFPLIKMAISVDNDFLKLITDDKEETEK